MEYDLNRIIHFKADVIIKNVTFINHNFFHQIKIQHLQKRLVLDLLSSSYDVF